MTVTQNALERFSGAVAIPTVSAQNYRDTDFVPFRRFAEYLRESFPLFHQTCGLTVVNGYGLVYRWQGDDSARLPLLLCAHYDVVPADNAGGDWKHPPFSGEVAEGAVWGRGALDIKGQICSQMEAVEALVRSGFSPKRDIYFAYGHDEEVGGSEGAAKMALYFQEQGIRFEGVLDEGGAVTTDSFPGMTAPIAMVGFAEKGHAAFTVTVEGAGGHGATPPPHTAVGRAAALIARLEAHPMKARLTAPACAMLAGTREALSGAFRFALGHTALLRPFLLASLAKSPVTNALIRSTLAVTQARGSDAFNVLPRSASFTVDARLLHGDSARSVQDYLEALFAGEAKVQLQGHPVFDPSPVSPVAGLTWDRIARAIAAVFPEAVLSPYYMIMGGTDARKYHNVCDNIYRFTPIKVSSAEQATMHGVNERLSIENYGAMITFYMHLITNFDKR
jgi:carboxypeptidase PM20D1